MGTLTNVTGSEKCTPAAPGFFVGKTARSKETQCKAGTYTNAFGQSACLLGPRSPWHAPSDRASSSKVPCDVGTYSAPARASARHVRLALTLNSRALRAASSPWRDSTSSDSKEAPSAMPGPGPTPRVLASTSAFRVHEARLRPETAQCNAGSPRLAPLWPRSGPQSKRSVSWQLHIQTPGVNRLPARGPGTKVTKGWAKEPEKCPEGEYSGRAPEKCTPPQRRAPR